MPNGPSSIQALHDAIEYVGGQSAMGRLVGVTQASVWKWVQKGKALPAEHVLIVEAATGISRHTLRPDIYGPKPKTAVAPEPAESIERAR